MNIDIKILKEILANQNTATHKQRYIPQEVCTRCKYIWDLSQKCKVVSKYKYQSMYYIILIEQETKITWSSQKMQKKIFDKTQHPLMLKMPDKWRNIIVMFFDFFFYAFQPSSHVPDSWVFQAKPFILWRPCICSFITDSHSKRCTQGSCPSAHMASSGSCPHVRLFPHLPRHAHMLWVTAPI